MVLAALLSASAVDAQQWSAEREVRIGEEQGVSFGSIAGVAVGADGRIVVLDGMEGKVHVFNAGGKREHTFGRHGYGPGEISTLARHVLLSRGEIVIVDGGSQRLSRFALDGTFAGSRPLDAIQSLSSPWVSVGDRIAYLARPLPSIMAAEMDGVSQHTVFVFDPRSTAAPRTLLQLALPADHEFVAGAPMLVKIDARVPQLFLAGDGSARVLLAASDTYRIRVFGADNTAASLTRTVQREKFTKAQQTRLRERTDSTLFAAMQLGAAASGSESTPSVRTEYTMPEYAPVITGLIAGGRMVLVARTARDDGMVVNWDVLSYEGRLLGTLALPRAFEPHALRDERLYGVEKDALDVPALTVYRIHAPARTPATGSSGADSVHDECAPVVRSVDR
jgi:hypothetical protein